MIDGVRPIGSADLDAVAELEGRCHAFPWTRGNFSDALASGYGAWLVRDSEHLVAYAVLMKGVEEAHLLNITVAPDCQRQGRGAALMAFLCGEAREWGALRMLLEVRPGNTPALAMYRRLGFREIGRRRAYYLGPGGSEDAIVMERLL